MYRQALYKAKPNKNKIKTRNTKMKKQTNKNLIKSFILAAMLTASMAFADNDKGGNGDHDGGLNSTALLPSPNRSISPEEELVLRDLLQISKIQNQIRYATDYLIQGELQNQLTAAQQKLTKDYSNYSAITKNHGNRVKSLLELTSQLNIEL